MGLFDGEECKTCMVLKEQLTFMREQNKQLTDTLAGLLAPKIRVDTEPVVLQPIAGQAGTWNRRRRELEVQAARTAQISKTSPLIAKVEGVRGTAATVDELEEELGLENKPATGGGQ